MTLSLVCVALLGLLLFGLGLGVSLTRGRTQQAIGHREDPGDTLHKLVRAHGNTAEYAPMLALLILAVGAREPSTWALWCMGLAVLSRYSIAAGLVLSPTLEKPHPLRFAGALGTYVFGLALSVGLLRSLWVASAIS